MTDYIIRSANGEPVRTVSIPASDNIANQLQPGETAELQEAMSPVRAGPDEGEP